MFSNEKRPDGKRPQRVQTAWEEVVPRLPPETARL
jgi:hypothetical protein